MVNELLINFDHQTKVRVGAHCDGSRTKFTAHHGGFEETESINHYSRDGMSRFPRLPGYGPGKRRVIPALAPTALSSTSDERYRSATR
jgi:hypothetical protein